jgi:arginyl-tRNA synthetase
MPDFERLLPRFPSIVFRAVEEYEPHYVTTYLTHMASSFNAWYASERILDSEHEAYKLALARAFAQTMKNGLWLLGIQAPDKM